MVALGQDDALAPVRPCLSALAREIALPSGGLRAGGLEGVGPVGADPGLRWRAWAGPRSGSGHAVRFHIQDEIGRLSTEFPANIDLCPVFSQKDEIFSRIRRILATEDRSSGRTRPAVSAPTGRASPALPEGADRRGGSRLRGGIEPGPFRESLVLGRDWPLYWRVVPLGGPLDRGRPHDLCEPWVGLDARRDRGRGIHHERRRPGPGACAACGASTARVLRQIQAYPGALARRTTARTRPRRPSANSTGDATPRPSWPSADALVLRTAPTTSARRRPSRSGEMGAGVPPGPRGPGPGRRRRPRRRGPQGGAEGPGLGVGRRCVAELPGLRPDADGR